MKISFPARRDDAEGDALRGLVALLKGPRTALLGTSKNAGKTTALNAIVAQLHRPDAPCGVLSSGVDGERRDGFSGRAKPPVQVREGVLIVSGDRALAEFGAGLDWMEALSPRTPFGRAHVVRARGAGPVMLAGLRHRRDLRHAAARLEHHGAARVLIDGALDRIFSASPELASEVLLVTGTPLGKSPEEVAAATQPALDRLTLPLASSELRPPRESAWQDAEGTWHVLDAPLPLAEIPELCEALHAGRVRVLRAAGIFAASLATLILRTPGAPPRVLLPDPSHLLIDPPTWTRLRRRGVTLEVEASAPLRAILLNPTGSGLSPREFGERFAACCPGVPLFDVVSGWSLRPAITPEDDP